MEDGDNMISSNDDNRITKISIKREHSQLFWYDIRNLPDSLIIEILARLPVESIFRFKCVSKHWQALISHHSFSRFYFSILNSNAASSLPFRILHRLISVSNMKVLLYDLRLEFYNLSGFCILLSRRPTEEARISQHFKVLAMSNGLILCCLLPCVYYVCDPLTQQWITLPTSKSGYRCFYGEGLTTRVNQDHILTGYTVVRLTTSPKFSFNNFIIEMFSSESSEWVSYKLPSVIPTPLPLHYHINPIHIYGAFNWLVVKHGMIAFDPFKDPGESVRLIPFPNDRDINSERLQDGAFQICGDCQGTLRYFEVAHQPTNLNFMTMWSIKDYEKGEWCCEFTVSRSDLHSSDLELSNWLLNGGTFLPLWFHPSNVNVVYLRCMEHGSIVSYDVLNRRLDVAYKGISKFVDLSWRMVIPFLLPKWPMLMPNHPFRV